MSKYRAVSAAEKYAELEALGLERPRCDCDDCQGEAKGWAREGRVLDGGRWYCRTKRSASSAAWMKANPEKARSAGAAYRRANPEKRKAARAAHYKANKEKENAQNAAWIKANPEKQRARSLRYRAENPEKIREGWRKRNKRRVWMFGERISMPDENFAEFARNLRDERKAALKEAS